MKIAVCVKQIPETDAFLKIAEDKKGLVESDINYIVNPYDLIAIEEAVSVKEKMGGEVTVLSLGPNRVGTALQEALAFGAQNAIHILMEYMPFDSRVIAKALAEVLEREPYDLILTGKQAMDYENGHVASMLSEYLSIPAVNVVTELEISGNNVTVQRQIEQGSEKYCYELPVIISVQRTLNEPRYPSIRNRLNAKKIPIHVEKPFLCDSYLELEELSFVPLYETCLLEQGAENKIEKILEALKGK